jgi:DNA-directed RNA polymerase specialized sigma24 family protein
MTLETTTNDAVFEAIESELLICARTMVSDPAEAQALVTQTLAANQAGDGLGTMPSRTQLFRLLRATYHSIDRSRGQRRARGALAVSLAAANETAAANASS